MSDPVKSEARQLKASRAAMATANPIRNIVDNLKVDPNHPLRYIPLSIGDPTLDGNLLPPSNYVAAVQAAAAGHKHDGYMLAVGHPDARAAVAEFYDEHFIRGGPNGNAPRKTESDVILASGASHALEMAIQATLDPGDVLLLPTPCFSLYSVICANRGIECAYYRLDPDRQWATDLESLEKAITERVRAILITNPSNPCGSNFTKENLEGLLAVAERHGLPVIADEIYAGMVFDIHEANGAPLPTFYSVAALTQSVPCVIVGGIAKAYVVPGHRLGWVLRHDPAGRMKELWQGIFNVAATLLGPNSLVQAALRNLLHATPESYREGLRTTLRDQARMCVDFLKEADGLTPVIPQGAMYLLVGIDFGRFPAHRGIHDDTSFAAALVKAKNVVVLPGTIFHAPGFVRIVFTKPVDQLREALARIVEFTKECMSDA